MVFFPSTFRSMSRRSLATSGGDRGLLVQVTTSLPPDAAALLSPAAPHMGTDPAVLQSSLLRACCYETTSRFTP